MTRPRTTAGNLVQVTAYVDETTFRRIERTRGRVTRSTFIADVLSEVFEEVPLEEE